MGVPFYSQRNYTGGARAGQMDELCLAAEFHGKLSLEFSHACTPNCYSPFDGMIPLKNRLMTDSSLDDDGLMDACSGTLDVSATYEDESGTQTIDLGGNFDVTRASGT